LYKNIIYYFIFQKIWKVRETVIEALLKLGYVYSFDISLPLSRFYEIVELTRKKLKDVADVKTVCGFGHIGELKKLIEIISIDDKLLYLFLDYLLLLLWRKSMYRSI